MSEDAKAALVLHGLGGHHLYGFLPGNDHKGAIGQAVSTHSGWCSGGEYGRVHKGGISSYASYRDSTHHRPIETVTWREVLQIVERGCRDGRREHYEEAFELWVAWSKDYGYSFGSSKWPTEEERETAQAAYAEATRAIRATTEDIIKAGVMPEIEQGLLW